MLAKPYILIIAIDIIVVPWRFEHESVLFTAKVCLSDLFWKLIG